LILISILLRLEPSSSCSVLCVLVTFLKDLDIYIYIQFLLQTSHKKSELLVIGFLLVHLSTILTLPASDISDIESIYITSVGCGMFWTPTYYHECLLLLLHGHTSRVAGTVKGKLRQKPVMWTWSEVVLVDSAFTCCKWSCGGRVQCWQSPSGAAYRFDCLELWLSHEWLKWITCPPFITSGWTA
jgi:hypothetical protein